MKAAVHCNDVDDRRKEKEIRRLQNSAMVIVSRNLNQSCFKEMHWQSLLQLRPALFPRD